MIFVVNSGTSLSQAQIDTIDSLVALGTTPGGSAITKDGSGNFVNTVIGGGGGTVTSVSVVSANGFAGSVATATTTPAITLTTSITGILKGNGTAISAATSGTDYSLGTSALATGILKSTTATGALTIAVAGDFPTLNQNTTGSAASLSVSGQTGLITFTGLASTNRVKTVRDAADTILELGGSYTPTGTWTSMTLVTPALGTPASGVMTNVTGTATGLTSGITNALKSATTTVDVSAATAPTSGQVLTATSGTAATWQTAAGGGTFKTGQTSYNPSLGSGTLTIPHGVGSTPSMIVITSYAQTSSNNANSVCTGTATSTSNETCTYLVGQNHNTLGVIGQSSSLIVYTEGSAGSGDGWSGTLQTLNSTNIVIDLTKNGGSGFLYIQWQAFK